MSLRPVEMLGQIPRSQSVGKIQEQMQQRGQVGQDIITNEQKQEAELKRKRVLDSEESNKVSLENDKEGNDSQQESKQKKKEELKEEKQATHPYKGNFIDFSG
ncbi:hypothetical protein [Bacillus sp. FJAT-45350]|uniref:hypothetical protein n=1 Tax=Bacillus sp. FJAT-45350 TaxID=2011014 RepID=UPI000BB72A32|nr:hypothetical protein [Bacillus sp. FJAT-45350]